MRSETIGLARLAVRQQVEIFGDDQISLNSLWRAVGSPAGHEPERRAELAAPPAHRFFRLPRPTRERRSIAALHDAVVVDLGRRVERSLVHRRSDDTRTDRAGLRDSSRFPATSPHESPNELIRGDLIQSLSCDSQGPIRSLSPPPFVTVLVACWSRRRRSRWRSGFKMTGS